MLRALIILSYIIVCKGCNEDNPMLFIGFDAVGYIYDLPAKFVFLPLLEY